MNRHTKALAILTFGLSVAIGGLFLTRQVIAVAEEVEAERLNRTILEYVAERNPQASIKVFQRFPEVLIAEARRGNIDHCLALAQAEVESEFRHDAVGPAGEIGLFQILPATAAMFESAIGSFRRPGSAKGPRALGDLADPLVNTRFALAYLRDIMSRKPSIRDALTEYNGGLPGRHPRYYRKVMGTYVEALGRSELRCRFRAAPKQPAVLTLLLRA